MKTILIIVTLLLLTLTALPIYAQQSIKVDTEAPVFEALTLNGSTFSLADSRGKVVLVTFWSTRCAICHEEIPKLNKVADEYRGKNVTFVALTNETENQVRPYLAKNSFKFEIVPNGLGTLMKYADIDKQGFMIMPYPAFFLVDQNGIVKLKTNGFDKTRQISTEIARLLGK